MQKIPSNKIPTLLIIVLFFGVSYSSGISVDTKQSINNRVVDCRCEEVNNADLVKIERLLKKVDVYSKLLLVLSKHNPEIKEKCEELSNEITTLSEMFEELKPNSTFSNRPLCILLALIAIEFINLSIHYYSLALKSFEDGRIFLAIFYQQLDNFYTGLSIVCHFIFKELGCENTIQL